MQKQRTEKQKLLRAIIKLLIKVGVIAGAIAVILCFVIAPFRVTSNGMYPMVKDGDLGIFLRLGDVGASDVVLYEAEGKLHAGRIVAVEDQTVSFEEYGFAVNGYQPPEEIFYPTEPADNKEPVTVEKGHYYILNDYRESKTDSRTYGTIPRDKIKGKLIFQFRRRSF